MSSPAAAPPIIWCEYGDSFADPHEADHYVAYVRPMPDGSERVSSECHYICDKHFHQIDRKLRKNAWHQFLRCVEPPATVTT